MSEFHSEVENMNGIKSHQDLLVQKNSESETEHDENIPKVSDRLLKPTMANIISTQCLIESKTKVKPEEDIWWERRNSLGEVGTSPQKGTSGTFQDVQSKLLNPTTASKLQQTVKHFEKDHQLDQSISLLSIAPLEADSPLLQPTSSVINGQWKNKSSLSDIDSSENSLHLFTSEHFSHVASRLHQPTQATESGKWLSKDELAILELEEKSKANSGVKRVRRPSEHILQLTACNENSKYHKDENEPDPREVGWIKFSTSNDNLHELPLSKTPSEVSSESKKVKEPSVHILSPTKAVEHGRYQPPITPVSSIVSVSPIPPTSNLLTPTKGNENGVYKKSLSDTDPREHGWSNIYSTPKSVSSKDYSRPPTSGNKTPNTGKKVKVVSETLLKPTENLENSKWVKIKEQQQLEQNKLFKYQTVANSNSSIPESLLKSTSAVENGKWSSKSETMFGVKSPEEPKKVKPVSESLLRSTAAVEHGKYIKHEERTKLDEENNEVLKSPDESKKVKSVSESLLRTTAAVEHGKYVKPEFAEIDKSKTSKKAVNPKSEKSKFDDATIDLLSNSP